MKKIQLFCLLALSLLIVGCKERNNSSTESTPVELKIDQSTNETMSSEQHFQKWNITNKRIIVLFGYDFNTEDVQKPILDKLKEKYGLDEDGGLILSYTYPDSFKHNGKSFSSEFPSEVDKNENDISGIVLLGAPEGTELALSRIQTFWNLDVPYPIIALFSQEEAAGLEANCDIVIDKTQKAEITGDISPEETISETIEDAPQILCDTIDYILSLNGSIPKDLQKNEIKDHAQQMMKSRQIIPYKDPESGIVSLNHFVLR